MFDTIYTVGCFDQFHRGHINLISNMKKYGTKIIVGIHDDASIEKLKKLSPSGHDNLAVRMNNLRPFVDSIFVIPSTDPSFYLQCMIQKYDNKDNACFIRGDDMPNFPGRKYVESKISVMFVPYTQGVSSTMIRKNRY